MALARAALLQRSPGPKWRLAVSRTAADPRQLRQRGQPARRQHPALQVEARSQCARDRSALREASGHEPDRIVQGYGHDRGLERCPRARFHVGGVRINRQHFRGHGGLCGARRTAQPGVDSRREDCLGQAFAGYGLRGNYLPAQVGLRWVCTGPHPDREGGTDLPAEFRKPIPARGTKDAGV